MALVRTGAVCRLLGPGTGLGVTRLIPSCPLEKMLLVRIELPVPDSTLTPVRTLKAIVLPAPDEVPPMLLPLALVLTITPLSSLPSGALPVMSVPMKLPWTRLARADGPSSRTPQLFAEIRFRAAAVVPPMVLPVAPRIATPS